MNRFLKITIITLLVVAGLTFCVRAAMRIVDNAGVIAFNLDKLSGATNADEAVVTNNLGEMTFNAIEAATAAKVTVRSADDANRDVTVRVSENMADKVEVKVRNGTLKIELKSGCYSFKTLNDITFEVSVPHCDGLSSLEAVAAASIDVTSPLTADKIKMEASGAAKITAPLDCQECEAEAAGASKIVLTGRCERLEAEASGASKIDAAKCESAVCKAEASGASKAAVWCTGRLAAKASGASKVEYRGDCSVEQSSVSGASSIKRIR